MTEETQHKVKEIKQSLRQLMNGVTAKSMREKGMDYHLSWGASIPDLQKMAAEYGKDYSLAIELWKENIRAGRDACGDCGTVDGTDSLAGSG